MLGRSSSAFRPPAPHSDSQTVRQLHLLQRPWHQLVCEQGGGQLVPGSWQLLSQVSLFLFDELPGADGRPGLGWDLQPAQSSSEENERWANAVRRTTNRTVRARVLIGATPFDL